MMMIEVLGVRMHIFNARDLYLFPCLSKAMHGLMICVSTFDFFFLRLYGSYSGPKSNVLLKFVHK